jgi:RND family efflux transporter MFP subunit
MGLLALALTATGCPSTHGEGDRAQTTAPEAIPVEVDAVTRRDLSSLYSTSATLRAERNATVIARARGVVERILVEEGDEVQAGQPLAELEDDEQRIEQARTQAVAETRQRELERAEELHARGTLSDNDVEEARSQAKEAKHVAELAALRLTRTRITAPFAGRILRRHVDAGETVADGTPILDMADVDPLMADVTVPERHVAPLSPGQTVRLVADASGEEVEARIERVAPLVDTSTGTVKVTLAVVGETELRPGTFVRVHVVVETHANTLVVPRPALVAVGQRWFLFRVGPDGRADMLEVELGFEEAGLVEVGRASSPLEAGDRVVVVGAAALSEESLLEVLEDRSAAPPPPTPETPADEDATDDGQDDDPDPA